MPGPRFGAKLKHWLLNPEVRPVWGQSDDEALLRAYQQVWRRKEILRYYYESWYQRIDAALLPGNVVEIAAGPGNFSQWAGHRHVITTDILPAEHIAVVADAHRLPFRRNSVTNVVMIDALHHFARPYRFFDDVAAVLRPGGRFIMLESHMSVWARFVFGVFHHEKPDFSFDIEGPVEQLPNVWQGNPAISRKVFDRPERLPLKIEKIDYLELCSYPLCGGFTYKSLLPAPILRLMHKIELTPIFMHRSLGLRMLAIMAKA